ncbi:MAG: amphi-Trp domain-containing protein [Gammaproteobacteria bacterium SHHR-1]|uniref:amphi-Trp domain-containing protein n=1 Tax=Magnetovirga frankeli TaxID=947516 RepID=UPI001294122A|nr:amphi-Trp domain-containing protein [gamma proteobacterium SS-5]
MQHEKRSFRHESLHDAEGIQAILQALGRGLEKNRLSFSDEEGEIHLDPNGLLNLKLTASKEEGRQRLNLRISWQVEDQAKTKKNLKIK